MKKKFGLVKIMKISREFDKRQKKKATCLSQLVRGEQYRGERR